MKNCHVPKVKCIFLNFTHDDLTSLDQPTPTRVYIYMHTPHYIWHYITLTSHYIAVHFCIVGLKSHEMSLASSRAQRVIDHQRRNVWSSSIADGMPEAIGDEIPRAFTGTTLQMERIKVPSKSKAAEKYDAWRRVPLEGSGESIPWNVNPEARSANNGFE